jgi:hypothetical protein
MSAYSVPTRFCSPSRFCSLIEKLCQILSNPFHIFILRWHCRYVHFLKVRKKTEMWKSHEIKNAPIILGFPPRSTFVTWIPPNWQSPSQISLIWSKVTVLGSNFNPCLVVIPTKNESSRAKSLLLMCSWQTLRLFVTLSHGWSHKAEEFANGANTAIQWGLSELEEKH